LGVSAMIDASRLTTGVHAVALDGMAKLERRDA
jgi:hypothetical protein